ncbi:MAG TPA: hypothetical protein VNZ52_03295 [Candidatus Thermoplasmatota archaeon]|nr:hypothetical protein [Candidatus Thermoplasmatota archaeon]
MTARFHRKRTTLFLGLVLLSAITLVPLAEAQSQLNVRSVGEFFVDAAGKASGQNVATGILEAQGALEGFTSLALGTEIFKSVRIDGFSQAQKIQGVGSSSLTLVGTNAVVSVYDNIASAVRIEATADTTIRYELGSEVDAAYASEARNVVDLYAETGAYLGSLILISAEEKAQSFEQLLIEANGNVAARLEAGSTLLFRAKPVYVTSEAYNDAVVEAAAEGYLVAEFITEFDAQGEITSKVEYAQQAEARLVARAEGYLQTEVKSRSEASAIVSYDLAYESVPAETADQVAVYVNGQLATRVKSAAEVQAYAEKGLSAFFAAKANGRTELLASTPQFKAEKSHTLAITATGEAASRTQAQAVAEARARAEAAVAGAFTLHGQGKLAGKFTSVLVAEATATVQAYTALESKTQVFDSVEVKENKNAKLQGAGSDEVRLEGPRADLTMTDNVYSSLLVEAKARAEAVFDLGANVKATMVNENLVRLEGPNGYAGFLIIAEAKAQAKGNVQGGSRLVTDAQGKVTAFLEAGAKVVHRSEAEAHASEDLIAQAAARGEVAAQIVAGFKGEAIATSTVKYAVNAAVDVTAAVKGDFVIEQKTKADSATIIVFDGRGAALAAKSASDIQVFVNGQAAVAADSVAAVLSAKAYATYFVEKSLQGALRVVVNTNAKARADTTVNIVSELEAKAKAAAKMDAFGAFKLFYDGSAVGSFVSLKTNAAAGVVSDYRLQATGQKIFSSIHAGASAFVNAGADAQSVLRLENQQQKLEIVDTTSAYMKILAKAESETVFNLAADVQAKVRGDAVVELVGKGGYLGSLIITDAQGKASMASEFRATAQNEVTAHLEQGAQIIFRTHVGIETELSAAQRTMMNQAIASGKVAGQVLVQTQAALAAQAHASAEAKARIETNAQAKATGLVAASAEAAGRVTTAITTSFYGDVQMVTAATQNRVDVTISSVSHAGKTVLISLDPETLKGLAAGNAVIEVDGQVAAQASSYADILNPADDNGASEYFVLAGEAGTQVLVSLSHFSTRTVTLREPEEGSSPLFMYATVFLGLLVVAETVFIARQKWRS